MHFILKLQKSLYPVFKPRSPYGTANSVSRYVRFVKVEEELANIQYEHSIREHSVAYVVVDVLKKPLKSLLTHRAEHCRPKSTKCMNKTDWSWRWRRLLSKRTQSGQRPQLWTCRRRHEGCRHSPTATRICHVTPLLRHLQQVSDLVKQLRRLFATWIIKRSQHSQVWKKPHAGTVFCLVTLTLDLLTPK